MVDEVPSKCPGCGGEDVSFIAEAFGYICSQCGTILDETEQLVGDARNAAHTESKLSSYGHTSWIEKKLQSQRRSDYSQSDEYKSKAQVSGLILGILSRYGQTSLKSKVDKLLLQVYTMAEIDTEEGVHPDGSKAGTTMTNTNGPSNPRMLKGGLAADRLAVAATFSVLKAGVDTSITLHQVCGDLPSTLSSQYVTEALQFIEAVLQTSQLIELSHDDPSVPLEGLIRYLRDQSSKSDLGTPDSSSTGAELVMMRKAAIETSEFARLAYDLCALCSSNGLNNRSAKRSSRKDLHVCAWAILMLAMEASCGEVCNQGRMSRMLAGAMQENPVPPTPATLEEAVKKRYVEITRMLTVYMRQLPWLRDECDQDPKRKANRRKGSRAPSQVKEDIFSIKPLPRRTIVRSIKDVLELRPHIEKALQRTGEAPSRSGNQWSAFGSTETIFQRIRASEEGRERIEQEDDDLKLDVGSIFTVSDATLASPNRWSDLLSALRATEVGKANAKQSQLASYVGSEMLQLKSLQAMSSSTVDALLFTQGELDSYLRSEEEMRSIIKARIVTGEWGDLGPAKTIPMKRPSKPDKSSAEYRLTSVARETRSARRTKAKPQAEMDRLMSTL